MLPIVIVKFFERKNLAEVHNGVFYLTLFDIFVYLQHIFGDYTESL